MDILRSLGLDGTVWIQLGFFLISYVFLSQFLFKPYLKIIEYRKKNTGGALEDAAKLNSVTDQIAADYVQKMKAQNEKVRTVFAKLREEGQVEEEKLLSAARENASSIIESSRKMIVQEMTSARENLRSQIPQMSELIASQLLGRNLNGK